MSVVRRSQGDLGEASALEWLVGQNASVFVPFGHALDCDIVALFDGRPARVQVKTSRREVPGGRWQVMISTRGGNRSWTGVAKLFDPARCDYLFVLTSGGRRWFIPSHEIAATQGITVGCPKWARFEIEPGTPFDGRTLDSPAARWGTEAVKRGGL